MKPLERSGLGDGASAQHCYTTTGEDHAGREDDEREHGHEIVTSGRRSDSGARLKDESSKILGCEVGVLRCVVGL